MKNLPQTESLKPLIFQIFLKKIVDYGLLVKFKLNLWVVFSAVMGYLVAAKSFGNGFEILMIALGGFLVTGASNALNQILERDFDAQMDRTANRPLAARRMTMQEGILAAGMMSLAGIFCLSFLNSLSGFLGMVSLISYAFIYTPLKRMSPTSVIVGAFPGALPVMIGVVAFDGYVSSLAILLFLIQFLWQLPHFWAIFWLAEEDYRKAGFKLMPVKNGDSTSKIGRHSWQICFLLVLTAFIGFFMNDFGKIALTGVAGLSLGYAWFGFELQKHQNRKAALGQMFASFAYLPLVLILIFLDKII
jgi:heme o synthase